jgi:hypothetical protein
MNPLLKRLLFWSPRVLCILFAVFLSMFALDVFDGRHGFWRTMLALFMHLIPVFALILVLVVSWRWEWVGAGFFPLLGLLYIWRMGGRFRWPFSLINCLTIAGPLFVLGALFLFNWLYRAQLRSRG